MIKIYFDTIIMKPKCFIKVMNVTRKVLYFLSGLFVIPALMAVYLFWFMHKKENINMGLGISETVKTNGKEETTKPNEDKISSCNINSEINIDENESPISIFINDENKEVNGNNSANITLEYKIKQNKDDECDGTNKMDSAASLPDISDNNILSDIQDRTSIDDIVYIEKDKLDDRKPFLEDISKTVANENLIEVTNLDAFEIAAKSNSTNVISDTGNAVNEDIDNYTNICSTEDIDEIFENLCRENFIEDIKSTKHANTENKSSNGLDILYDDLFNTHENNFINIKDNDYTMDRNITNSNNIKNDTQDTACDIDINRDPLIHSKTGNKKILREKLDDVTLYDGYVVDGLTYSITKEIKERIKYLSIQRDMEHEDYINHFKDGYPLELIYAREKTFLYRYKNEGIDRVFKYVQQKDSASKELRITRSISHENIVKIYYAFPTEEYDGIFTVMEPMDYSLSIEFAMVYPEELKNVIRSVALALKYLQSKKIQHCDIKITNILAKEVEGGFIYKLCDFGGSKYIKHQVIYPGIYSYTLEYLSPETFYDESFSETSDVFSLGHVIWFYSQCNKVFFGDNDEDTEFDKQAYHLYLSGNTKMTTKYKQLDIVKRCCVLNPTKRATYDEIIEWCNSDKNE